MICCCVSTQAPKPTQNRQIVQLLKQLDEKVEKEKELEQERDQLRQRNVETVHELESSKETIKVSSDGIDVCKSGGGYTV